MKKSKLVLGLLLGLVASASAQSLANWTKYKNIAINTKTSGAGVAANVANFPVLVRLDSANAADVFTGAQAGGADIRFANAAGAQRPFQIESWNATTKRAAIWVLADTVKGNDSVASLRLYWGNATATTASNGAAVFDTANGYRAVYHMSGTGAEELDATVMANHMAASDSVTGSMPGDTIGVIGGARKFAGDSTSPAGRQYFVAPGTAGKAELNWGPNNPHTISAWVYSREFHKVYNQYGHGSSIFNKGDKQFAMQAYGDTANRLWEGALYANVNNGWRQVKSKNKAEAGTWVQLTTTWAGGVNGTNGTAKLYINGALDSTTGLAIGTGTSGNNLPVFTYNLYIGANPTGGSTSAPAPGTTRDLADGTTSTPRFWNGYLDNITLARGERSADFVKLAYETQKAGANALTLGATQTQTITPVAITNIRYILDAVEGSPTAPRDTLVFTVNVPVNLDLEFEGGPMDSAKLTGNTVTLPAGLTINLLTGKLSGTPTATFAAGNRTLTVYSSLGNPTRGLRISVVPGPLAGFDYAVDTAVYVTGLAINANSASWSAIGRAPTGFSVLPALPAGLSLNAATGAISGTPSAIAAAANYVVKAFNATDTVSATVRLSVISVAAEDYAGSAWPNKLQVWVNTQPNGAGVGSLVTNFPVLVRLDSSNFNTGFAQASAGGADLRFTKLNNTTRLSHQIERWDATAKKAEIWVLVDSVKASAIGSFRMHWGNATAPNLSSGPTVFDTGTGFQAVYHMNGANGANEDDASNNGFGASAAAAPGTAPGIIGPARTLNGTSQYFRVANSASGKLNFMQTDSYTLSSWINPTVISTATSGNGHKIIDKGDNQYVLATYGNDPTTRFWEITIKGNGTWNQCQADGAFAGSTAITAESSIGSWNHLVGTYTGGAVGAEATQRLYFNGVKVNECVIANTDAGGRTETVDVHLGVQSGAAPSGTYTRYWNGLLDEPRLHNRARSDAWVKLEYQNQRAAQTLLTFGGTGPTSIGSHTAANFAQGFSVKAAGQGLMFQIESAREGKAVMSLVDMFGRTVWSGAFAQGSSQLAWNGTINGAAASTGVYVARLTLLSSEGKIIQVQDRKVPFTR